MCVPVAAVGGDRRRRRRTGQLFHQNISGCRSVNSAALMFLLNLCALTAHCDNSGSGKW